MMNSTRNWLLRHRLVTLTGAVALTALMLAPELADAGYRRRSRRCCCGNVNQGYSHNSGFVNNGYGQSYGQSGYGWGSSGYANSANGYQFQNPSMSDQADAGVNQQGQLNTGDPQPNLADNATQNTPAGNRITTNRPITGNDPPPAPQSDSPNANGNRGGNAQNQAQQVRQMRQRIQSLEQENTRLKQQLNEARQSGNARSATDRQNGQTSADATVETKSNVTSNGAADADLPKLPKADTSGNADDIRNN